MKRPKFRLSAVAVSVALMASLLTLVTGAGSANAAGCTMAPTNGTVTKFLGFRTYELHVPAGLTGSSVPLLLDLHGGGGNGRIYEGLTGWSTYADQKKDFIVAYPNSQVYGFWNYAEGSSEVGFLKNVVSAIASTYCIDLRRVFVDGHSNGGLMADRLACDAAGTFAAFAPYAGSSAQASIQPTGSGGCKPSRPVPIAFFHGDQDTQAPIAYQQANRNWWINRNGCAATPTTSTDAFGSLAKYSPCTGGADIWWRVLSNQSHAWPTGAKGEDQRNRIWEFFDAHPLP